MISQSTNNLPRRDSVSSTNKNHNYASNYGNQMFMNTQKQIKQYSTLMSRQKSAGKLSTKNQSQKLINLNITQDNMNSN